MKYNYRPVVLVVMDGWGEWQTKMGNPISCAHLPTIDELDRYYPKLLLEASGLAVGLPWGVFGNSEVGHQTMGCGQIIYHHLPVITAAIQSKRFFDNEALLGAVEHARQNGSALHFIGLASDGGVHSHIDHLGALLELAAKHGLEKVYVHAIMDGRDTPPHSGQDFIKYIQRQIDKSGVGRIATLAGRYFPMDRNRNWDRVEKAMAAYVDGDGLKESDPLIALEKQYDQDKSDEYIEPVVITDGSGQPGGLIGEGDAIVNFNFRSDRARQISYALADPEFDKFKQVKIPAKLHYAGFNKYADDLEMPIAFPPQTITTRVGELLSKRNKKQLRIAETEKYAHVTYFFNGGLPDPFPGEDRIFVPSKNAPSYATIPEMSAYEVSDKLKQAAESNEYDFIMVNFANPDMVGHTGDFKAGIKAVEVTDECVKRLIGTVLGLGGCLLITADHGNIEEMVNLETGEIDTQHSSNPVPFWFVSQDSRRARPQEPGEPEIKGMLADIAVTVLELMDIKKPAGMIGISLLDRLNGKKTAMEDKAESP